MLGGLGSLSCAGVSSLAVTPNTCRRTLGGLPSSTGVQEEGSVPARVERLPTVSQWEDFHLRLVSRRRIPSPARTTRLATVSWCSPGRGNVDFGINRPNRTLQFLPSGDRPRGGQVTRRRRAPVHVRQAPKRHGRTALHTVTVSP